MYRMDWYGFPRTGPKQARPVRVFQTGDMVRAHIPAGKHRRTHIGRMAIRATGSFNITAAGTRQGISWKHCYVLHRVDGYSYSGSSTR